MSDLTKARVLAAVTMVTVSTAAAGVNPVGTQPTGTLSGKIVYIHAGHGYTPDNLGNGSWSFQRSELFETIEDLSNQDQMTFLADYLWKAGATVVPLRPIGHQPREVVIDNDDPEVTFSGVWNNSGSGIFFGDAGDVPYRFASTTPTETASARYRPTIPVSDCYPVYAWTRPGGDRVNQLYRVSHPGGVTEVTVDHTKVGNGLVYLGTYYFEAGTSGYVDISNRNTQPGVVIADMIRFGNGLGDIDRGAGVSTLSREDEPALLWIERHAGQGIPSSEWRASSSDRTATVSASPRWAAQMNRSAAGSLSDRVFLSYHSNAGGSRGTLGLVNGNNNSATMTPNQFLLANTVAGEINDDMVGLNGMFEHNWFNRSTHTLDRSDIEFGEINNLYINDEFDATIIEWAFHDSQTDTDLMRDPRVRIAVARATYQGLVRYFNQVDGGATPISFLPDPVTNLRAANNGDGTVTLRWNAPQLIASGGGAPSDYRVYTSVGGRGYDGGTNVGSATTELTLSGLDAADGVHYFKVVAVNPSGESLDSQVVAATPYNSPSSILIVNGFDRIDRPSSARQSLPGGNVVDRAWLQFQNSGDYVVQVGRAVEAFNPSLGVDTVQNESLTTGQSSPNGYDAVIWILGEESANDATFDTVEQIVVTNYINGGGNLIVSGAEIGWDLDNLNNGRSFYNNTLCADYVADDANTYNVLGVGGSIFSGLSFSFDDGGEFYDTEFPDVITAVGGGSVVLSYAGGLGGGAAIQRQGLSVEGDVIMLAFPFETILGEQSRADVMAAMLNSFCDDAPAICGSGCVCEWDGVGATPDVNDLLAFLGEWFAGSLSTDLTGSGTVESADLLAFLACWFPASAGDGCP